jgi:hypothetical protein
MEIMEIIKDSFMFPANNVKALIIYVVITFIIGLLAVGGVLSCIGIMNNAIYGVLSFVLFVIAVLIGFVLAGYEIDIIKTGIEFEDIVPDIDWKNDLIRGVKAIIVAIVYFIIPAIITLIVAFITNVPGNIVDFMGYITQATVNTNGTVVSNSVMEMVPKSVLAGLGASISITVIVAFLLFVIFSFFQYIANARLANTDSLGDALNIPEVFSDFSKIGFGKVVATVVLLCIIIAIINIILSLIFQKIPALSIINMIVTPYIMFAMNRANGLLYSDIA